MALDEPVFNLVEEVVHGGFDGVIEQIGKEWYDLSDRPGSVLVMDQGAIQPCVLTANPVTVGPHAFTRGDLAVLNALVACLTAV